MSHFLELTSSEYLGFAVHMELEAPQVAAPNGDEFGGCPAASCTLALKQCPSPVPCSGGVQGLGPDICRSLAEMVGALAQEPWLKLAWQWWQRNDMRGLQGFGWLGGLLPTTPLGFILFQVGSFR